MGSVLAAPEAERYRRGVLEIRYSRDF